MKIGEDGYWEREDRHDRETARVRETAKEAVAFYLTIEALQSEGIDIPKNLIRWSGDSLNDLKVAREIGALITQAKGLGLDSVSPELKKELLKHSRELRDMYIGQEYLFNRMDKEKKKVLDKDVSHLDYFSGKIDVGEIIKKVKDRETNMLVGMNKRQQNEGRS